MHCYQESIAKVNLALDRRNHRTEQSKYGKITSLKAQKLVKKAVHTHLPVLAARTLLHFYNFEDAKVHVCRVSFSPSSINQGKFSPAS